MVIYTVASFKGGVGKTTTAVHMAAYLQRRFGSTLLIDGDPNRSASHWAKRGSFPFNVVDERQATRHIKNHEHIVIDTEARPEKEDLAALADGCDLLVLPSTCDALALDALMQTIDTLQELGTERFKVLLTVIPPRPSRDGEEAKQMLTNAGLPVFDSGIRRLVAFQKAALAGVPVYESKDARAGIGWRDYEKVCKELVK